MSDRDVAAEEEANRQRKAEQEAQESDSLVDSVGQVVGSVLDPLRPGQPDEGDLEEQREENDQEQRPS